MTDKEDSWDNVPKWRLCACGTLHVELNFTTGTKHTHNDLIRTFALIHPPGSKKSGRKHFCEAGSILGLILESHFWGYKGDKQKAIDHIIKELENMELCQQSINEGKPSCISAYVDIIKSIGEGK